MEDRRKLLVSLVWDRLRELLGLASRKAHHSLGVLRSAARLKDLVKEAEQEGRRLRAVYRSKVGDERSLAWRDLQAHGSYTTRPLLLAYALVRGVPYRSVERSSRAAPWLVRAVASKLIDVESGVEWQGVSLPQREVLLERVEEWIEKERLEQEQAEQCASASTSP